MKLLPAAFVAAFHLASCSPAGPKAPAVSNSVDLVQNEDGLAYATGSSVPYSGEVIGYRAGQGVESVAVYREGRPHGLWQRFGSKNRLKREERYESGSKVHERQWYDDGVLKFDAQMRDGVRFGRIQLWWPDGRLRRTSSIGSDFKMHGHALEYAEDGTVLTDAIFDHGTYISGTLRKDPVAKTVTAQAN